MFQSSLHIPDSITKVLKLTGTGDNRKIRVSSNFLPLYNFDIGDRINVAPLSKAKGGIRVSLKTDGPQKIYHRTYKHRKNNPMEAVLELSSKEIMDTIPNHVSRIHVEMRRGGINITPIQELGFSVQSYLKKLRNPMQMFAALSSGVDIHSAQRLGFEIKGIVEYRPQEKRDKADLTETGVLTAIANNPIGHVFNEDIYSLDWNRVAELIEMPHVPVMHASLQCDHFSNVCPASVAESYSLETTRDMFIPLLDGVKRLKPGVLVIEQVEGFQKSTEWRLLTMQLERLGYFVDYKTLDARKQDGINSRKRMYAVCSIFPNFEFPENLEPNEKCIWDKYIAPHLVGCRDVTHSKSIQDGARVGRLRTIKRGKPYSPTPIKSQERMAKDTLVIEDDGRYFMPTEALLKSILSIPKEFDTNIVGKVISTEIVGQSIDYHMHHRVLESVKEHLMLNLGRCTVGHFQKNLI